MEFFTLWNPVGFRKPCSNVPWSSRGGDGSWGWWTFLPCTPNYSQDLTCQEWCFWREDIRPRKRYLSSKHDACFCKGELKVILNQFFQKITDWPALHNTERISNNSMCNIILSSFYHKFKSFMGGKGKVFQSNSTHLRVQITPKHTMRDCEWFSSIALQMSRFGIWGIFQGFRERCERDSSFCWCLLGQLLK